MSNDPTPEQIKAASNLVRDGGLTCGTCGCIERERTVSEKIAQLLAAREADKDRVIAELRADVHRLMPEREEKLRAVHTGVLYLDRAEKAEAALVIAKERYEFYEASFVRERTALAAMTSDRDGWRLQVNAKNAELAALRAPGDAEIGRMVARLESQGYLDEARALRSRTAALKEAVEWIGDTVGTASGEQQEFNDDTEALEHIDKRGRVVLAALEKKK